MPGTIHSFLDEDDAQATATTTTTAEADAPTRETRVQTRASKKAAAVQGSGILRQLPDDLKRKIVAMAIHPGRPGALAAGPPLEVVEAFKVARNTCAALLATRKRSDAAVRAMRLHMYRHTFCIWQMQARLALLMTHFPRNPDLLAECQKRDQQEFKLTCALAGKNPEMWRAALQSLKDTK